MTFKTIIIGLAVFFLIRIIFKFFLPVFRMVRSAQKTMNHLREQQSQYQQQHSSHTASSSGDTQPPPRKQPTEGEYIDFEEVK